MGVSHPDRETCIEFVDECRLSMKTSKIGGELGRAMEVEMDASRTKQGSTMYSTVNFFFLWAPLDNLSCVEVSLRTVLSVRSLWQRHSRGIVTIGPYDFSNVIYSL